MQKFLLGESDFQAFGCQGDYRNDSPDEGHYSKDHQYREPIFERADSIVAFVIGIGVIEVESRQVDGPQRDRFIFALRPGEVLLLFDKSVGYGVSKSLTIIGPFGAVVLDQ